MRCHLRVRQGSGCMLRLSAAAKLQHHNADFGSLDRTGFGRRTLPCSMVNRTSPKLLLFLRTTGIPVDGKATMRAA